MRAFVKLASFLVIIASTLVISACGEGPQFEPDLSAGPILVPPPKSLDPTEEKRLRDHEDALIEQGFKVVKGSMKVGPMVYSDQDGNFYIVEKRTVLINMGCPPSKPQTQTFSVPDWNEPPYTLIWGTNLFPGQREVPFKTQPTDREVVWYGLCA